MPNDDAAKILRRLTALICRVVCIAIGLIGVSPAIADGNSFPAKAANIAAAKDATTEFTITDGAQCNTIRTGKCQLSGTLKIQFAGRILPHENTKVVLYGKGVSSLTGKFDRVEVPKGWLYDLKYDHEKPEVVIENFRPDHPPAFPGAEG